MNNIELNYILYYADFLSLKCTDTPVTDNCKYFFIHGAPKNAAYIVGCEPVYDKNNPYFIQSVQEYELLKETQNPLPLWNHICEELEDVKFMLNQIKEYYLIQEDNTKAGIRYRFLF